MIPIQIMEYIKRIFGINSNDDVKLIEVFSSGKSGAFVYSFFVTCQTSQELTGAYVLKFTKVADLYGNIEDNEAAKYDDAVNGAGEFAGKLVKTVYNSVEGEYFVQIMKFAGGTRVNLSLDKLRVNDQVGIVERLAYDVMKFWNSKYSVEKLEKSNYINILTSWLRDYRINSESNMQKRLDNMLTETDMPAFLWGGKTYPNPIYYIRHPEFWESKKLTFSFIKGKMHGDLHAMNVIINGNDFTDYNIIDFDFYEKSNFVFYDLAYLELSLITNHYGEHSLETWVEIIKEVFGKPVNVLIPEEGADTLYLHGIKIRNGFCRGVIRWMAEEQGNNIDSVTFQYYAAKVAVAMNYFNKNAISDKELQSKFLFYASINIEKCFNHFRILWDKDHVTRLIPSVNSTKRNNLFSLTLKAIKEHKLVAAIVILIVLGGILFGIMGLSSNPDNGTVVVVSGETKPEKFPPVTVKISVNSGNSFGWFEEARREFLKIHPEIKMEFLSKSTKDAIEAICHDQDIDAWVTSDNVGKENLEAEYEKRHKDQQIVYESRSLAATPLVIVGWKDRMDLLKNYNVRDIYKLITEEKKWMDIGGKSEWGLVKFMHTNPYESTSGTQFLALLMHDFKAQKGRLSSSLERQDFGNDTREHLRNFEEKFTKTSVGANELMEAFINGGSTFADMIVNYEYYALAASKSNSYKASEIKIFYPNPTIISNKPFIVLKGKNSTQDKINVCKSFMVFLLSQDMQKLAVGYGYRPVNAPANVLHQMEKKYSSVGFRLEYENSVSTPDYSQIEAIRKLIK